ncbi:histidine phosphatase family protein [Nitratireductor sp. GISD-1A_MAKvit]|uniref:SixA phosphatase family protein n=1 Tax=Nitratireductor sp. GISD-1A_MAKvit TaxID=3234198 RepID=UPI0034659545
MAGFLPDVILCSTARRAVETLENLTSTLSSQQLQTQFHAELYNSDALDYVCAVQEAPIGDNILVIGHNPMMEDVVFELSSSRSNATALNEATSGFPTCALAVLSFSLPLAEIGTRSGRLEAFLKPPHDR